MPHYLSDMPHSLQQKRHAADPVSKGIAISWVLGKSLYWHAFHSLEHHAPQGEICTYALGLQKSTDCQLVWGPNRDIRF